MNIMLLSKTLLIFFFLFCYNSLFSQDYWQRGSLKTTENGHYFQFEDGTPFFWLGDTGWFLFKNLNKNEINQYLNNRKEKGFNVIQVAILRGDLKSPNRYGEIPFHNLDPTRPNEKYFELVDWTLQQAMLKGIFIGLLPTWGDQVSDLFGTGSIRFNKDNAYEYGLFLGKRYKKYPNIIWILGGDQPAFTDSCDWRPIWREMIRGINVGSEKKTLVTYHPWGEHSSSEFWGNENTLDFNMIHSGHARKDINVWKWIEKDFNSIPAKPVLDGEPNYEDHPINWEKKNGYFRDYDVRKQLYRSVFSGACGVTYGHEAIRQFYSPEKEPSGFPDRYWYEALDRPGAFQAGYLKDLILSRPPLKRIPDQGLIKDGQDKDGEYITAFRDEDYNYAMIYLPVGKKIEINTYWIKGEEVFAWWFNPRTGESLQIGKIKKQNSIKFEPPSLGVGNDWVLVVESYKGFVNNNMTTEVISWQAVTHPIEKNEIDRWSRFEFEFINNNCYIDPFTDVELLAEFTSPDGRKVKTWGFYDGKGIWKLRFMPDQTGVWEYIIWFSDQPRQKIFGKFQCLPSEIPGMIAADETNPIWFGFKGGEHTFIRSFHVGDRFFASNWPSEERNEFLNWIQGKYNTLSIASHYLNRNTKGRGQGWKTPDLWDSKKQRPNPNEYSKMENILDELAARKIIVFPFGGFFGQGTNYPRNATNQYIYIKYTLARLGSYWNILLNVSGPEPLLPKVNEFTKVQIDLWGQLISSLDIYNHLLTVHNQPDQNPFINSTWTSYQCLQGPKTTNLDNLYWGIIKNRNMNQPLYAQETLWYGNIYHHEKVGREYSDDDLRRNAWTISMAGGAINFADNKGDSSSGFSGTLNFKEIHQEKHEIIWEVWDFFESIPFYKLSPSPNVVDNGFCLAKPGEIYLIYLPFGGEVSVNTMQNTYQAEWIKGSETNIRIPIGLYNGEKISAPSGNDWLLYLKNK